MSQPTEAVLSELHFNKLQTIIHEKTGITIADGRSTMLVGRLKGRLRDLGLDDYKAYIEKVTSDPDEMQELINRVTTNKTYFYRTPRIWEHFRDNAVPQFLARKAGRAMRVWSAAASTGEEAHTIGIILEQVRRSEPGFNYSVLGTDVSARVLKKAETGNYEGTAFAQFQKDAPDLFAEFMQCDDAGRVQISPEIRTRIKFKLHNLQKRLSGVSPFDVVFLRNVLIYFTNEDQENILRHVHALMPSDGILYIGESETLSRLNTPFEIIGPMIYRPVPGARRTQA